MPRSEVQGTVGFDHVSFAYQTGFPIISDLTLQLPAGTTTAIVGATGAGKTTLIKLLLRFYDVTGGSLHSTATTYATSD